MYSVSDRLERLPFSSFHFRLLMIGGLGLAFEALDAGIIAFIIPSLRVQWGPVSYTHLTLPTKA